jgi:hypothetical protein
LKANRSATGGGSCRIEVQGVLGRHVLPGTGPCFGLQDQSHHQTNGRDRQGALDCQPIGIGIEVDRLFGFWPVVDCLAGGRLFDQWSIV